MTTRALFENDLETVAAIERECFSEPWTAGMLAGSFSRSDFCGLLMEDNGEAVGYVCGETLFEDAEIANIAVDIPFRGKGYGGAILGAMLEKAKSLGASRALLEVRVSNATAIRLYEKFGFVKYGERKRYYEDGEDAALMEKKL